MSTIRVREGSEKHLPRWAWLVLATWVICVLVLVILFVVDPLHVFRPPPAPVQAPVETYKLVIAGQVQVVDRAVAAEKAHSLLSFWLKGRSATSSDVRQYLVWAREQAGGIVSTDTAQEYVKTWIQPDWRPKRRSDYR